MQDRFTNLVKLRIIRSAGALAVCKFLVNTWVPTQGIPLELMADIGSGCKNALTELVCLAFGIKDLYASPRRHQANGGIESVWRRVNGIARAVNFDLYGQLTDTLECERAIEFLSILLQYILLRQAI